VPAVGHNIEARNCTGYATNARDILLLPTRSEVADAARRSHFDYNFNLVSNSSAAGSTPRCSIITYNMSALQPKYKSMHAT